jgi:predicted NBD/HSP70 family sugar kinase
MKDTAIVLDRSDAVRRPSLRDSNLHRVLRAVLRSGQPLSRAGIATATDLTRSTVSRLVDELLAGHLLDELPRDRPPGRGRPGVPLVPGGRVAALGLQVNAGFLAARVVDLRGRILAEDYVDTDLTNSDPSSTLRRLDAVAARLRRELPQEVRLVGCGLAVPGIVSVGEDRVLSAPNLGWTGVRVRSLLGRGTVGDLAVRVGNEADLAARTVAEDTPGGTGRFSDFIYVSGEVGVGGAAVIGGRVFTGRHGWAGEIGHVTVDPNGPACRCGSTGCLEQYAGRPAILRAAGLPAHGSVTQLLRRVDAGDPMAERAVRSAARALGVALASAVNVLDIPTVVLGGHLAEAAGALRPLLVGELASRVMSARWQPPAVEVAGEDRAPGATGAAYLLLDGLIDSPARWVDRAGVSVT